MTGTPTHSRSSAGSAFSWCTPARCSRSSPTGDRRRSRERPPRLHRGRWSRAIELGGPSWLHAIGIAEVVDEVLECFADNGAVAGCVSRKAARDVCCASGPAPDDIHGVVGVLGLGSVGECQGGRDHYRFRDAGRSWPGRSSMWASARQTNALSLVAAAWGAQLQHVRRRGRRGRRRPRGRRRESSSRSRRPRRTGPGCRCRRPRCGRRR